MFAALIERFPWTSVPTHGFLNAVRSRMSSDAIGLAEWVGRAQCGFVGHAMVLHLEPERLALRCMKCGQQSPGWAIHEHN